MFLYDTYGGSRIFVVWRPAADAPVAFSLQSLPFMTPEGGSKRLVPNKAEMLACIRRLGGTMIRSLE
jgi:Nrap protein domain 6